MDNLGQIGMSLMDNWGKTRQLIAASHQGGSTLFLPHLFSLVPVPSPELCIANSKIDLFVVHSFGMIHLLTSQILRRVYEFTYPRIHEDNPITSEYSARYFNFGIGNRTSTCVWTCG